MLALWGRVSVEPAIVLRVENLRTWFPVKTGLFKPVSYVKAVDGVSFSIHRGEALAIVGESGCGKTTLGRTTLRVLEPISGKIYFHERDITHSREEELKEFRRKTAMIFQDPYSSLNPAFNVYRILEEPLIINGIRKKEERAELIYKALEEVKLNPVELFASKYPHMLSGGQRQRVAIARALILKPEYVVADEPVSMLDASVRAEILYLLNELKNRHQIAFMYITHDLATAKYLCKRTAIMYAGKIVEVGPTKEIISNPRHPYTKALIEALPDPDPSNRFRRIKVVPGEPPNLLNPPPGCRFSPRCPYAKDICREREPELEEGPPGHYTACFLKDEI